MTQLAEELKAVAERWMNDIWRQRNLDVFIGSRPQMIGFGTS